MSQQVLGTTPACSSANSAGILTPHLLPTSYVTFPPLIGHPRSSMRYVSFTFPWLWAKGESPAARPFTQSQNFVGQMQYQTVRLHNCQENGSDLSLCMLYKPVLGDLRFSGLRSVTNRLLPLRGHAAPLQGRDRGPSTGESFYFVFFWKNNELNISLFRNRYVWKSHNGYWSKRAQRSWQCTGEDGGWNSSHGWEGDQTEYSTNLWIKPWTLLIT